MKMTKCPALPPQEDVDNKNLFEEYLNNTVTAAKIREGLGLLLHRPMTLVKTT